MHIGVFDVLNKVLFQKLTGVSLKNTIFLQVFKVFCICFQNPYFLVLAFPFLGFEFLCFFFVFLVVVIRQIRLLCSGFCFLLFWVSLVFYVVCLLFFVCFCFFFFWRV